jgi:predicted metalloprotease with PDZ domain
MPRFRRSGTFQRWTPSMAGANRPLFAATAHCRCLRRSILAPKLSESGECRMRCVLLALAVLAFAAGGAAAEPECKPVPPTQDQAYPGAIRLAVDTTDINQRIFHVRETLPAAGGKELVLLYPEWLPGTHAPWGRNRLNKIAGLTVRANGAAVTWSRDPCNVFAFRLTPPDGAATVDVDFDYLSADSGQSGPGSGAEATPDLLTLEWSSVVLYPAGYAVGRIAVDAGVKLPGGWEFATALEKAPTNDSGVAFKRVSLETLVDSPLFAGDHAAHWDLDPGAKTPVRLDAFADRPELFKHSKDFDSYIEHHRELIRQAYKLFGAKHYDHYDFLVTLSDNIAYSGLEHHQSSEDGTSPEYFTSWEKTIASRDLLPHEYVHSWNGKFRRPADLLTANYNTAMGDSLLWVYEGQTQYWGKVLAARSGLWSKEQALDALAGLAAYFSTSAGRKWRNLQDTNYDEIVAPRFLPQSWASWRRSKDYYDEGLLLWLDADTLIREKSQGQHSLDDFAREFFGGHDGSLGPESYKFDDVVAALNAVQPHDWAKFLRERLDDLNRDPLDGIRRGGYRLTYNDTPGKFFESGENLGKVTNLIYSVGLSVDKSGKLRGVLWDGPAFKAGLSAGVQIKAVNGVAYDADRFKEAIRARGPIELIVEDQDHYRVVQVDYHDGLRYPHLTREEGQPARLDDILAAR